MNSSSATAVAEPATEPDTEQAQTRPKRQPLYSVILHNDHLNTMEFVVSVLCKVFRINSTRAKRLMMEAHRSGRAIVWTGVLEVAELKRDQIRSCGADPVMKMLGASPLRVTIEPISD